MQQNEFNDENLVENQFLSERMEYQCCPFCSRSFFRGKLVFHLKLCNQQSPMVNKNQKKSPIHKKNALSAVNSYERCSKCQTRIPSYLKKKHEQNCTGGSNSQIYSRQTVNNASKTRQNNSSQLPSDTFFPKIRKNALKNEVSQKIQKKLNLLPVQIKVRDELRCFRRAQQVQKVTCDNCGRKFSQSASLRHIPICANLKLKEKKQKISLRKTKNFMNPTLKMRSTRTSKSNLLEANTTDNNSKFTLANQNSQCTSISLVEVPEPKLTTVINPQSDIDINAKQTRIESTTAQITQTIGQNQHTAMHKKQPVETIIQLKKQSKQSDINPTLKQQKHSINLNNQIASTLPIRLQSQCQQQPKQKKDLKNDLKSQQNQQEYYEQEYQQQQ